MDESSSNESLYARIEQLEREREELQKDVEKLCMQHSGPSYIALATQMHFRRTAGLEQEIGNLKKKLSVWTKENYDLKEELSEAKRIRTYIDQLHKLEVEKNTEAAKQLEYLRGVVTDAFSDRDHAIMEAEKAKENEDLMSQKLNDAETRLQELTQESIKTQDQLTNIQIKLTKQEHEIEIFRKIIDKFFKIRMHACSGTNDEESVSDSFCEDVSWGEKCACLDNDTPKAWSFNVCEDVSAANYIADLQAELDTLRGTVDGLQNKLQMGLEIEKQLKKKVKGLEKKKITSDRLIVGMVTSLRECYSRLRIHVTEVLEEGRSDLQSAIVSIEENLMKLSKQTGSAIVSKIVARCGCLKDKRKTVKDKATDTSTSTGQTVDFSDDLARALQEKVSALLLLSQEEERHANVHTAIQETLDEMQKSLKQVTSEKVKALMELAVLKQENEQLLQRTNPDRTKQSLVIDYDDKGIVVSGREGKLTSLWKKTSLKRLLGTESNSSSVSHSKLNYEGKFTYTSSNNSLDNARLQMENTILKGNMINLEYLTSNIRKLRHSLLQVNETSTSKQASSNTSKLLDEIISEAHNMKTPRGGSLPLSWSAEGATSLPSPSPSPSPSSDIFDNEKIDSVSSAIFEMSELLVLAAEIIKEKVPKIDKKPGSTTRILHSKNKTN